MYIRTNDGVYEVSHYNAYATHKRKGETLLEGYKTSYIKNENIIAQSENLEELCDEFVKVWCKRKVNPEVLVYDEQYEEEKENILLVYPKGNIAIYGAIWTKWGLKYVAKMDNEGKLVLI